MEKTPFAHTTLKQMFRPINTIDELNAVFLEAQRLAVEGTPQGRGPQPPQASDAALLYAHGFSSWPSPMGTFDAVFDATDPQSKQWLEEQRKATQELISAAWPDVTSNTVNHHARKCIVGGLIRAVHGDVPTPTAVMHEYDTLGMPAAKDAGTSPAATVPAEPAATTATGQPDGVVHTPAAEAAPIEHVATPTAEPVAQPAAAPAVQPAFEPILGWFDLGGGNVQHGYIDANNAFVYADVAPAPVAQPAPAPVTQPAVQQPTMQQPVQQQPMMQQPVQQQPMMQQPMMQQPMMQQPMTQQPVQQAAVQQPMMQQPMTQQPAQQPAQTQQMATSYDPGETAGMDALLAEVDSATGTVG